MADKTRWGIIGAGNIARKFAQGLGALADAELIAIGSRSQEKADAFGEEFKIPHRHASYDALANDPEVDAVYIATPHPLHKENTLACLARGKAVLCEKPFALNSADALEMAGAALRNRVFLMEAMWTHFFPAMAKVRELIQSGAIGEVRMMRAEFGFRAGWNPQGRLLNPELGGGALLDVGVYTIALAHMVFGREPSRITGLAHLGETGVDEQASMALGFDRGELATLTCAVRTSTTHEAVIYGTDGWIHVPPLFWQPRKIVLHRGDQHEEMDFELLGNGYSYEADEVMRCLREGRTESDVMPLSKTLAIMRTMDRLRVQWGLHYPGEA